MYPYSLIISSEKIRAIDVVYQGYNGAWVNKVFLQGRRIKTVQVRIARRAFISRVAMEQNF
jgi:hypothetical protein